MGSCCVTQAGLRLLGSSDSAVSTSLVAGATGMHHHSQLLCWKFLQVYSWGLLVYTFSPSLFLSFSFFTPAGLGIKLSGAFLSQIHSPFYFLFWDIVLLNYPRWPQICDAPALTSRETGISWDYRHAPQCQA